jgi:hypothetical protein
MLICDTESHDCRVPVDFLVELKITHASKEESVLDTFTLQLCGPCFIDLVNDDTRFSNLQYVSTYRMQR